MFGLNVIRIGIYDGVVTGPMLCVYRPDVQFEDMRLIEQLVLRDLTMTYGYSLKPDKKRHFIIKNEEQDTFINVVDSLYNKYCK
jgi:hypothetical protein